LTHPGKFNRHPALAISTNDADCDLGWQEVVDRLNAQSDARRIAIECYPGADLDVLRRKLAISLAPELLIDCREAMLPAPAIEAKFAAMLGDDPVFGHMTPVKLDEFFDAGLIERFRGGLASVRGRVVALGAGATLVLPEWDLLIYVNVSRWEIQQRQRQRKAPSLGLDNAGSPPAELYKRGYFLDWRASDQRRHEIYDAVDFWIDGDEPETPAMLSRSALQSALSQAARRPFCLVPFFDPGPWGGEWMRRHFDLPDGPPNYAWCFNCVPEENTLALRFGARVYHLPALMLVHEYPEALLGGRIVSRFGAEFPIRFDFLDTMEGGNLSLQVHPLRNYVREQFGLNYTQDESYYLMDAAPDATVFLGLREGIDREAMTAELRAAQAGGPPFRAEEYVNVWPAKKHDHFLIPAGTIHCSGRNSMVLEISATPYIFTFKLWDWGRVGLNGLPRPIHLDHGLRNIQWDRTTPWVRTNLIAQQIPVACGDGWREERTGLHSLEFLETRRHWFTAPVLHDTQGNLNVLNLVEGETAIVESPVDAFPPLTVHYAETFVIPAAVGPYVIRPAGATTQPLATIKAYVREGS
jgi:mannose-6-phosphate isomerase class I